MAAKPLGPTFWQQPLATIRFELRVRKLLRSQYWSREKLDALALKRLRAICKHANRIPFWHDAFRQAGIDPVMLTSDTLAKVRVTTKKDFLNKVPSLYLDAERAKKSYVEQSSGSTGKPFAHWHDFAYEMRTFALKERMYRLAGKNRSTPVIIVWGRERHGYAFNNYFSAITKSRESEDVLNEVAEISAQFQGGAVLRSSPSQILKLAQAAEISGVKPNIKSIIAGGEEMTPEQSRTIEEAFGAVIFRQYGMSEVATIAFCCKEGRLHINEEWLHAEVADDAGIPVPDGVRGRIVVTSFFNKAMPFIRYETGDIGVISNEPCPCGRTLRTIEVVGRKTRIIQFEDGRTSTVLAFSSCIDRWARSIRQYQIVRTGPYAFNIKIVPAENFAQARKFLLEVLLQTVHPNAEIDFELVGSISSGENGKAIYFIDQVV